MNNPVFIEQETLEDIADAIREKIPTAGQMLPSAFAQNIMNISGGGVDLPETFHMGTFTLQADSRDDQVITHGFDTAPRWCLCFMDDMPTSGMNMTINGGMSLVGNAGTYRNGAGLYAQKSPIIDDTTITFQSISSSYRWLAGYTYRWFAWL